MTAPTTPDDVVRVLLADDHAAIRAGLRLMLEAEPRIHVVGEAADGRVALAQARALRPDVVLMDLRMPALDGVTATEQVVREGWARVLVLTAFDLDEDVIGALRAGAAGFLLKTVGQHELCDAVLRVAAGDGVLGPEVTRTVIAHVAAGGAVHGPAGTGGTEPPTWWGALTPRERDVLACLVDGRSNAQIADRLSISVPTAKTHVSRVLDKMGCTSRLQAAVTARDAGVVLG